MRCRTRLPPRADEIGRVNDDIAKRVDEAQGHALRLAQKEGRGKPQEAQGGFRGCGERVLRRQSESSVHVLQRSMSGNGMKTRRAPRVEQMRAQYDFDYSKAERGKYFKRLLKEGSNVVVLDRDVAKAFPDSAAVNKALRSVMKSRKPRRVSRP